MTPNSKTETSAFARITTRREFGLAVLIALITIFVSFFDPRFLDAINLRDIIVRCAPTAIVACGMMLVIVTAEIDISVGSLMALTAAAMGIMLSENEWNLSLWIGLPATLMLGTAVGLEESQRGIRVTNVYPGEVDTPLLEQRPQPVSEERRAQMLKQEDIAQVVLSIAALPARAHIPEIVIKPVTQAYS